MPELYQRAVIWWPLDSSIEQSRWANTTTTLIRQGSRRTSWISGTEGSARAIEIRICWKDSKPRRSGAVSLGGWRLFGPLPRHLRCATYCTSRALLQPPHQDSLVNPILTLLPYKRMHGTRQVTSSLSWPRSVLSARMFFPALKNPLPPNNLDPNEFRLCSRRYLDLRMTTRERWLPNAVLDQLVRLGPLSWVGRC